MEGSLFLAKRLLEVICGHSHAKALTVSRIRRSLSVTAVTWQMQQHGFKTLPIFMR